MDEEEKTLRNGERKTDVTAYTKLTIGLPGFAANNLKINLKKSKLSNSSNRNQTRLLTFVATPLPSGILEDLTVTVFLRILSIIPEWSTNDIIS